MYPRDSAKDRAKHRLLKSHAYLLRRDAHAYPYGDAHAYPYSDAHAAYPYGDAHAYRDHPASSGRGTIHAHAYPYSDAHAYRDHPASSERGTIHRRRWRWRQLTATGTVYEWYCCPRSRDKRGVSRRVRTASRH